MLTQCFYWRARRCEASVTLIHHTTSVTDGNKACLDLIADTFEGFIFTACKYASHLQTVCVLLPKEC